MADGSSGCSAGGAGRYRRFVVIPFRGAWPATAVRFARAYRGTNSRVASSRAGSAKPSTHLRDPLVGYFSP